MDAKANKSTLIDYSKPLDNAKYERFSQEYHIDCNATQAATRAKYSAKTAGTKGQQLLQIIDIAGRIAFLKSELGKKTGITAERVMAEWAKIGFSNLEDYVLPSGSTKPINQLTRDQAAAISSITFLKAGGTKLTFYSKETALEHIGRHIGIYEKDNQQKKDNLADFLKAFKSE